MSAQEPLKIDSLKQILQLENVKDTTKVSANYLLGIEYLSFDINESKLYAKKALNLSLKNKRYTLTEIYSLLGLLEYEVGKNDSARYYYDKALSELDTYEGNNSVRAVIYGNYSSTYEDTNNYEKQLEYSLKAINLSKEDPKELCFLYFNHSVIYEDAGFHAEGLQYLNLAHKISKEVKDLRIEAYSIRNLGHFAIENNDFETAKDYLNRGLEICSELNSIEICYHIHFAFGRLLIELGEFEEAEISILQNDSIFTFSDASNYNNTYTFIDYEANVYNSSFAHSFENEGNYSITLIATNNFCSDTLTETFTVQFCNLQYLYQMNFDVYITKWSLISPILSAILNFRHNWIFA